MKSCPGTTERMAVSAEGAGAHLDQRGLLCAAHLSLDQHNCGRKFLETGNVVLQDLTPAFDFRSMPPSCGDRSPRLKWWGSERPQ